MTKEETKELIKVMQAYVDGKDIEWFNEDHWEAINDPCWEWDEDNPQYRVKPEPHYRPFRNAEEVMEAIKEHGDWVKGKDGSAYYKIVVVSKDFQRLWLGKAELPTSYVKMFEEMTFADGALFGKLEE